MNGKIFRDSANLYQDQARILFDYYKKSAEEIVAKEIAVEGRMDMVATQIRDMQDLAKSLGNKKLIGFVLFFTLIGLVFGIIYMLQEKEALAKIDTLNGSLAALRDEHKNIFRDYRVTKLGIAYVPIASQIPFENNSIIVDHTGSVAPEEFRLQIMRRTDLLKVNMEELQALAETAPVVEQSSQPEQINTDHYSRSIQKVTFNDYFGNLDRSLRTFALCLNDLEVNTVSLPIVHPDTEYADFIAEHATRDAGNLPVIDVYDTSQYDEDIDKFRVISDMRKSLSRHSAHIDEVLRKLMIHVADSVQTIASVKLASAGKLVDHSNVTLMQILKSSYNHYSPQLEAEEIDRMSTENFNYSDIVEDYKPFNLKQSSRVKYDPVSGSWVAEDGSKTNHPFGINQIQEEIVAPIVQNLLTETRLERLKIYNHIKDRKLDYLNQWHQDTEDFYGRNRAESSALMADMRANLTDFIASSNTLASLKSTADSMKTDKSLDSSIVAGQESPEQTLAAFHVQSEEFKKIQVEFDTFMKDLKEDIDRQAAIFEHIEYFDASLRDGKSRDMAAARARVQELDERRKPLSAVSPLFAETSELPPAPNVEPLVYEHIGINLSRMAESVLDQIEEELSGYEQSLAADGNAGPQQEEPPRQAEPTAEPDGEERPTDENEIN